MPEKQSLILRASFERIREAMERISRELYILGEAMEETREGRLKEKRRGRVRVSLEYLRTLLGFSSSHFIRDIRLAKDPEDIAEVEIEGPTMPVKEEGREPKSVLVKLSFTSVPQIEEIELID